MTRRPQAAPDAARDAAPAPVPVPAPMPEAGGSYMRAPDGSLTRVGDAVPGDGGPAAPSAPQSRQED